MNLTVLMPAYNAAKHIEEAIQSILNQTFPDFKLLVINDGSSDETEAIIQDFCKNDDRVVYVENEENLGLVGVLKKGVELTTTKYLARMDADDIALPNRLALQVAFMESNQDLIASGGAIKYIGLNEGAIFYPKEQHDEIIAEFFLRNPMVHPTMILRNDLLKKYNLNYSYPDFLNTREYVWPEDYALWYQLSKKGKLANLEDVILEYRAGEQSISFREKGKQYNRYSNFFTYLFSDLGLEFTKKDIKIHTEFALAKEASFSVKEYKIWIDRLISSLEPGRYKTTFVQNLITDQWRTFSFRFADQGFWSGIKCIGMAKNKFTFFKYLLLKNLSFGLSK